ncbi:site-specific integrase [Haloterrigena sp. SYSU A558-1]|uniref:Site-specific integrase n=1 Tax=Haloterrigena gelatinilytica TaxID=2741724 RepID=A0ABX2LAV4_9EURY|nr:site-specific integrase [Haloterrigena gelatinilytica]NUC71670.1 site-specific integrase [Haloterrigena gelatinilytica]
MRLKDHRNDSSAKKVIFSDKEFEQLLDCADTRENPEVEEMTERIAEDRAILELGGYAGLRREEIAHARATSVYTDVHNVRYIEVFGKDTGDQSAEVKKRRNAYLPDRVAKAIRNVMATKGIRPNDVDDDTEIFDISDEAIRYRIDRISERMAEETGNSDWEYLSCHDLRRRYAQRHLVELGTNPRHVMEWGGWSSFRAIEPYLSEPTEKAMAQELERVGLE